MHDARLHIVQHATFYFTPRAKKQRIIIVACSQRPHTAHLRACARLKHRPLPCNRSGAQTRQRRRRKIQNLGGAGAPVGDDCAQPHQLPLHPGTGLLQCCTATPELEKKSVQEASLPCCMLWNNARSKPACGRHSFRALVRPPSCCIACLLHCDVIAVGL
jgi:hypothetical protein